MKTSLEINDALYQAARLKAAQDRTTVRALVEEGLQRVLGQTPSPPQRSPDQVKRERELLDALCAQVGALPLLDDRSPEQILDYDQDGVWP